MQIEQGAAAEMEHVPVLLHEAVQGLQVRKDGVYLDGTFGRGGHARAVLAQLGAGGKLLLMDRDPTAIAAARESFGSDARVQIRHGNFAELGQWDATAAGLDGVLLDLGVSSPQLDDAARGFSFRADAPLDMRMDMSSGLSAAEFLARTDEAEIANVLWQFGEERMAKRIAKAIVERRTEQPLTRTLELADLIERTIGRRRDTHPGGGKHPATRSFQALRIRVNAELDAVNQGLRAAVDRLNGRGRLAVISFHSLEDRIVKNFLRDESQPVPTRRGLPPPPTAHLRLKTVGGAQFAADNELASNPRARSAVLRVAERLA
jgi:16S rRNA (cytosine1402-N4)-methyltransferase